MSISIDLALELTARVLGIGVVLDSVGRAAGFRSWVGDPLRRAIAPTRLQRLLGVDKSLNMPRTTVFLTCIVAMRCGGGVLLISTLGPAFIGSAAVLTATVLIRVADPRGSDASDQMTIAIAIGLVVGTIATSDSVQWLAVVFIAFNASFAYFVNGLSKLNSSLWRNGLALSYSAGTISYGHSRLKSLLTTQKWLGVALSRSVLLIEIAFPLALTAPTSVLFATLLVMGCFHLAIAIFMRLGSFFWVFTSTYPAVIAFNHSIN